MMSAPTSACSPRAPSSTRDILEKISTRNLKRLRLNDKDPLLIEKIDEIEEMTSRQIDVLRKITDERIAKLKKGDELAAGRDQAGESLHRHEAQAFGGRQNGGTPRQQGRHRSDRSPRRHALHAGRHAGGNRTESSRRSFAYERGPDSRNPSWLGFQGTWRAYWPDAR